MLSKCRDFAWGCSRRRGTAQHAAWSLTGVHENCPCGHSHPEQGPWVLHVPEGASLLTMTMRVFQATEKTSASSSPR